jgi:hypothetical protein
MNGPGTSPGTTGLKSTKESNDKKPVENSRSERGAKTATDDGIESDEAFERRLKEAYGSLDHPLAKGMLDARAEQKAKALDVRRKLIIEEEMRMRTEKKVS